MKNFSIQGFAEGCRVAMAASEDRRGAALAYLERTLKERPAAEIMEVLEGAIPAGATLGEMVVYTSPELTMLYARVPARFQSGIHNHTVFACMGQLSGAEVSTVYERTADGRSLTVASTATIGAGGVFSLPSDAIHHIENPESTTSCSLHIYGGDFNAVQDERSLWSGDDFEEESFSFPALLRESVKAMKRAQNTQGLAELARAIPAVQPLIDG